MKKICVKGNTRLNGTVKVQGSKNSVLPILAAAALTDDEVCIYNCPNISDVQNTLHILEYIGYNVRFFNNTVKLSLNKIKNNIIPDNFMRQMRSSILLMGSMLNKTGYVKITLPGGCELGARPIDLHLKAFEKLGVNVVEHYGFYECSCEKIIGNNIYLDFPSVGATENIMILSCRCVGKTVIYNAAKEPEIVDLQNFLNKLGADISGAGTNTIVINGVKNLHSAEYFVMPDRIVASTYLIAGAITGGEILIEKCCYKDLISVISVLRDCGFKIDCFENKIKIFENNKIKSVDLLRTLPYPGFPTDVQSIITPLFCIADGTTVINENLFENRFKHIPEFVRMGADINVIERNAIIRGVKKLHGADVVATDLRSAAGLIVAAICADGVTNISGLDYLARGYEKFIENLNDLGADITFIA